MNTSPRQLPRSQGTENAQLQPDQPLGKRETLLKEVLAEARHVLGERSPSETPSTPLRAVAQAVTEAPLESVVVAEPLEEIPAEPAPRVEVFQEPLAEVEPRCERVERVEPAAECIDLPASPLREARSFSLFALPPSLSPRWRRVVNVAAITLALWVPIAWAIAAL